MVFYTTKRAILSKLNVVFIIFLLMFLSGCVQEKKEHKPEGTPEELKIMKIKSPAFSEGESIPSRYTCDGENINPPLEFFDVPEDAKSLALIVDDPDAPRGDWVHWLIWNIPPNVSSIPEGSAPADSVNGRNDFGKKGYGGPCPPSGTHRYQFKLYALDTILSLDENASKSDLERAMQDHILDQATLVGLYKRV